MPFYDLGTNREIEKIDCQIEPLHGESILPSSQGVLLLGSFSDESWLHLETGRRGGGNYYVAAMQC